MLRECGQSLRETLFYEESYYRFIKEYRCGSITFPAATGSLHQGFSDPFNNCSARLYPAAEWLIRQISQLHAKIRCIQLISVALFFRKSGPSVVSELSRDSYL